MAPSEISIKCIMIRLEFIKFSQRGSSIRLFEMSNSSFITYTIAIVSSAGRLEPPCTLNSVDFERCCPIAAATTA